MEGVGPEIKGCQPLTSRLRRIFRGIPEILYFLCLGVRLILENPEIWARRCLGDDFQFSDERSRSREGLHPNSTGIVGAHCTAASTRLQPSWFAQLAV